MEKKMLKEKAEQYITTKTKENELGKETKKLNAELKSFFIANEMNEYDTDVGRLVLTERVSESFDEESLIEFLKTSGNAKGIVKKKEYIDYDALESAIYNERLDADSLKKMNDFKITKITNVLSIK